MFYLLNLFISGFNGAGYGLRARRVVGRVSDIQLPSYRLACRPSATSLNPAICFDIINYNYLQFPILNISSRNTLQASAVEIPLGS